LLFLFLIIIILFIFFKVYRLYCIIFFLNVFYNFPFLINLIHFLRHWNLYLFLLFLNSNFLTPFLLFILPFNLLFLFLNQLQKSLWSNQAMNQFILIMLTCVSVTSLFIISLDIEYISLFLQLWDFSILYFFLNGIIILEIFSGYQMSCFSLLLRLFYHDFRFNCLKIGI